MKAAHPQRSRDFQATPRKTGWWDRGTQLEPSEPPPEGDTRQKAVSGDPTGAISIMMVAKDSVMQH